LIRARQLTGNETLEEGLGGEISVVLLEVLLAGGGELHSNELEATVLEARDDGANESTLVEIVSICCAIVQALHSSSWMWFAGRCIHTWTPSGLMAMKLEQLISLTGMMRVIAINRKDYDARLVQGTYVCSSLADILNV
jgi:hypothetical protein